jgi:hypothetical protein
MTTRMRVPLGTFVGARSGDKGGNANVGLWIVDPVERAAVDLAWDRVVSLEVSDDERALADARYEWLAKLITPVRIYSLLPDSRPLGIDVYALPNLRAVNVVIRGYLGRGVAETTRSDPQAKGLGEHIRSRLVDIPVELLVSALPGRPR